MKKIISLISALIFSYTGLAQQEILDNNWVLHSMVIDGNIINVQPQLGSPSQAGINFYESSSGVHHFSATAADINSFSDASPTIINADTFVVQEPIVTLGACFSYCTLESQYLYMVLLGNGGLSRIFDYEIIDEGNGNKTLIIDTPEGNRAVHGNYILSLKKFRKKSIVMYPNPVKKKLYFDFKGFSVEKMNVLSLVGSSIFETKISQQENSVDLSFLSPGIYFIKTTYRDGDTYVSRFIKE